MKNTVKWLWAIAVAAAMVFSACSDGSSPVKSVHVRSISLDEVELELIVKETATLTPTIQPGDAANTKIKWSSSNVGVATVSDGIVTAVAKGKATITVTTVDRKKKATCAVTVIAAPPDPIAVTGVTLDKTSVSLAAGKTVTLIPTVKPDDAANKTVIWSSDDENIATVSDGTVTAVAQGKATITVTTEDGDKTAACDVMVFITSDTGIELVLIPAGTFMMGSPDTDPGRFEDETQHSVTLTQGFYMGVYQVTQEQYEAVMGTNPSHFTTANGRAPANGESGEKRPVETVTWYDTVEFCNKLSVLEGLQEVYTISEKMMEKEKGDSIASATVTADFTQNGYRLPTEAQWEYACRAGTTTAFNNGIDDPADANSVSKVAWFGGNSGMRIHEVGLKQANEFGLYDMHGNVYEWCWDWYGGDYSGEAQTDPEGASVEAGRVLRGGSWGGSTRNARSTSRSSQPPGAAGNFIGFRLVRGFVDP